MELTFPMLTPLTGLHWCSHWDGNPEGSNWNNFGVKQSNEDRIQNNCTFAHVPLFFPHMLYGGNVFKGPLNDFPWWSYQRNLRQIRQVVSGSNVWEAYLVWLTSPMEDKSRTILVRWGPEYGYQGVTCRVVQRRMVRWAFGSIHHLFPVPEDSGTGIINSRNNGAMFISFFNLLCDVNWIFLSPFFSPCDGNLTAGRMGWWRHFYPCVGMRVILSDLMCACVCVWERDVCVWEMCVCEICVCVCVWTIHASFDPPSRTNSSNTLLSRGFWFWWLHPHIRARTGLIVRPWAWIVNKDVTKPLL